MAKDTLFTNESGSAQGPIDYVTDVFPDVSLPASTNTGLTDNANTNPLSLAFSNDDAPRFGVKTLYIKSVTLIENRSKWVGNRPTYLINWHENFPSVVGYLFGNFSPLSATDQPVLSFKTIGDGIGVNGVIRKVAFIVNGTTTATAAGSFWVDGILNGSTGSYGAISGDAAAQLNSKYILLKHSATNETYDLHDYRFTSLQDSNTLNVVGVVVYFEHPSGLSIIDQPPGSTYVRKSKVTTTAGVTLSLPTPGSSLGGECLIYKTASSGYATSAISATTIASLGTGTSGTALLTVTTGHGASFLAGYGIVVTSGSSQYVGGVVSISTDTLTVSPNLPYNISGAPVYRSWYNSASASINASLMQLSATIDFAKFPFGGLTSPILDPRGRYCIWGRFYGITSIDTSVTKTPAVAFGGPGTDFMQVDGPFGAAEVEFIGNGILHATFSVNGVHGSSVNAGQTGAIRRTIFAEGGPGWNSFSIRPGTSMGLLGIVKINLYKRNRNIGISNGILADFEVPQAYTDRGTIGATVISLGIHRRIYADQLNLGGSFARSITIGAVGGVGYYGTGTTANLDQQYYGKNFSIIGTLGAGTLTLDGVGIGLTFNIMQSVATEGFHRVIYTTGAGATSFIEAFDYVRNTGEFNNLQFQGPVAPVAPSVIPSEVWLTSGNGHGSVATSIRRYSIIRKYTGLAITYIDNASSGTLITINESGNYAIDMTDERAGGAAQICVTRSLSSSLTSDPVTVLGTSGAGAVIAYGAAGAAVTIRANAPCTYLYAGDVIRPFTNGATDATVTAYFRITKVSN